MSKNLIQFKVGDIVECTEGGWNNSMHPDYKYLNIAIVGEKYKISQIYYGGVYSSGETNSFKTECGKCLWTNPYAYKIISSSTDYEIY